MEKELSREEIIEDIEDTIINLRVLLNDLNDEEWNELYYYLDKYL